ncbi:MAG TPA: ankyrin repeat domain-containing protein [Candidatus Hydrogenedentes bacterium]|nr:ankyrin repeat domain-containing protein [Candidatus Hydrogenedentota bacterium]HPG68128.1 ankyrin repeat domain-containing protein [Candidatus Hydrogenedentota bacterium]
MDYAEWLCKPDDFGETPLTRISRSGRMTLANIMLLQDIEDHLRFIGQMPPMHRAAYLNYGDAIEDMLDEGGDPTEENASGETALHLAVRLGNLEATRALVKSGMDVNMPSILGFTPLHWGALNGRSEIVELLMANGADPHAHEWVAGGMTPIVMARKMGYTELAEVMEIGANAWYQ